MKVITSSLSSDSISVAWETAPRAASKSRKFFRMSRASVQSTFFLDMIYLT